jgi:hypothetical protein
MYVFESCRLWPPFRSFGEHFYTYQILLDLKVEAGLAIKIEPASTLLYRPNRQRSDRSAGAHEELVANDVLHGLQIAD